MDYSEMLEFENKLMITILVVGFIIYITPTVIAFFRNHEYKWVIMVINIFLGATGLGWVGSLVWSIWPTKKNEN